MMRNSDFYIMKFLFGETNFKWQHGGATMNIERYEIAKINDDEFALVVHLSEEFTEFASELGTKEEVQQSFTQKCKQILLNKYPHLKVSVIKVIVGGILVSSLPFAMNVNRAEAKENNVSTAQATQSSNIYYQVGPGDSLWKISRAYNTTPDLIKRANQLSTDTVQVGQKLVIPTTIHTVQTGDYLSVLAKKYGTTVAAIKEANKLTSDNVKIGQAIVIPKLIDANKVQAPVTPSEEYTVVAGDSLSIIAKKFGITTDALKQANQLTSDRIYVGQKLVIPTNAEQGKTVKIQPVDGSYTVVSGDSLSLIAKKFNISTEVLKKANQLSSDVIYVGQKLVIPKGNVTEQKEQTSTYIVKAGDSLWNIAKQYNTTVDALKKANNLQTDTLYVGQQLTIPSTTKSETETSTTENRSTFSYSVRSGDSLSVIAKRFGISVDDIRKANKLTSDTLRVGQVLTIPNGITNQEGINTITYKTHTVVSGDNIWDLSVKYGIPQAELLKVNHLTTSSRLSIGQQLKIPVHHIAEKPVVSERHGELLDWWTEAQYVFPIGKVATVTDFETGKSFKIKRTVGANHADSETLTVADTNIAKSIWGGFSWKTRAVIIEVDGRKIAASMSFMPHDVEYIKNNGITGHFDVYFHNSLRHKDGKPDPNHQAQVEKAAGVTGK